MLVDLDSIVILSSTLFGLFAPWLNPSEDEASEPYYADLPEKVDPVQEEASVSQESAAGGERTSEWLQGMTSFTTLSGDSEQNWIPMDLITNNALSVFLRHVMTTCLEAAAMSEGVVALVAFVRAWREVLFLTLLLTVLCVDYWRWSKLEAQLQRSMRVATECVQKEEKKPGFFKGYAAKISSSVKRLIRRSGVGDSNAVATVASDDLTHALPRRRLTDLCLASTQNMPASTSRDAADLTSQSSSESVEATQVLGTARPTMALSRALTMREVLRRSGKMSEEVARRYTAKLVLVVQRLHEQGVHDLNISLDTVYLDDESRIRIHLPHAFRSLNIRSTSLTHVTSLQKLTSLVGGSAEELSDWRGGPCDCFATDDIKACGNGQRDARSNSKSESHFYASPSAVGGMAGALMTREHCADWTNVGVILFWMLTGNMPFFDDSASFPPDIPINTLRLSGASKEAVQLVMTLLCWRYESWQLMGATDPKTFARNVRGHAFFADVNWDEVEEVTLRAPVCKMEAVRKFSAGVRLGEIGSECAASDLRATLESD